MLSVWYIFMLNFISIIFISASRKIEDPKSNGLRVIGSRDALPGEFSYVLRIEAVIIGDEEENVTKTNVHLCSCACLKPTWTLTAAHCIQEIESLMNHRNIMLGIKYTTTLNNLAFVKILSMFINPTSMLNENSLVHNDIGLLQSEKITLANYAKISYVDYSTLYGLEIFAVGYGLTTDDNGVINDTISLNKTLQVMKAIITKCDTIYSLFCLSGVCGQISALCPGDSGGPVIHSSGIVGINTAADHSKCKNIKKSLRDRNSLKSFIGMITPVSPFVDWLVHVMK